MSILSHTIKRMLTVTACAGAMMSTSLAYSHAAEFDMETSQYGTLHSRVSDAGNIDIVKKALAKHKAMQMALTSAEHHYTLIAPADKAFEDMSEEELTALTTIPVGENVSPLFDHYVIPQEIYPDELMPGESKVYYTVGNNPITITRFGNGHNDYVINNKNVLSIADADNGRLLVVSDTIHATATDQDNRNFITSSLLGM